jgi:hypothetical protein
MDRNQMVLEGTNTALEYLLQYQFGLNDIIHQVKALSGSWKKIVPLDESKKDLFKYLEFKHDLNEAESSLRNGSHKQVAFDEVARQARQAKVKVESITSFETEAEALEILCDYLTEVVDTIKRTSK